MRSFGVSFVLLVACSSGGIGFPLGGSDSSSKSSGASQSSWQCSVMGVDACSCRKLDPGTVSSVRGELSSCVGYNCCLLTEKPGPAHCECMDTSACQAEAASRTGAVVVAQCPLPGEVPAGACAKSGENCRYDYLSGRKLDGCCAGSICRANADHVPVCQPASDEDTALWQTCNKVAHAASLNSTTLATTSIRTSAGELRLEQLAHGFYGVGPGGCLNSLDMTFNTPAASLCNLELEAELRDGRLIPTNVFGELSGCEGYTGPMSSGLVSESNPAAIPFEVTFNGLACDGNLALESYCVAGSFDWHLGGTIDGVTFEDQHLVANGVLCNQRPMGECPSQ